VTQGGRKPTKAERKEEARKARMAELKRRQRKARLRKITWITAVVVAAAGIAVAVIASQQASKVAKENFNKVAGAGGCEPVQNPKVLPATHIARPQKTTYSSNPPTSGPHWSDATAPTTTGVHFQPIQDEEQVHNLEHSHVIIQYKTDLVNQDIVTKLEDFVKSHPTQLIIAPREDMPVKVAFTAWGVLAGCNDPNDKVVDVAKAFFDKYKGSGPEGFKPGTPQV
jgi:cytoskeletal protein RodZ